MKVRDLLKMDIDIDVCDDYTEDCYIVFCGKAELTEEGEKRFAKALEIECEMHDDIVILKCDTGDYDEDEETGESARNVRRCKNLFYSLAGYCLDSDYKKWFKEEQL